MKGYRTGGDWADITSLNRNEIVFEGRHKAYGAYYIRQRYPNALLFALFSAVTFMLVCAVTPYIVQRFFNSTIPPDNPIIDFVSQPIQPFVPDPPKKMEPPVKAPKAPVSADALPVIDKNHHIDTDNNKKPEPLPPPPSPPGNGPVSPNPPDEPGAGTGSGGPPAPPVPPAPEPIPTMVSEMPQFPNGTMEDYLLKNIEYPAEETEMKVQGTVYVYFVIETDGSVSNVRILKGVEAGPGLEREAKRVIAQMPKWLPGKQNGHPTRVQFRMPIRFQLR